MKTIKEILCHFYYGEWHAGIGWWKGSAKLFTCGRNYYDGWWYGFRIGPFWASCGP